MTDNISSYSVDRDDLLVGFKVLATILSLYITASAAAVIAIGSSSFFFNVFVSVVTINIINSIYLVVQFYKFLKRIVYDSRRQEDKVY